MSETAATLSQYWAFAIYLIGILALVGFMIGTAALLGGRAYGRNKNTPFEAGALPTGNTKIRFSAKFYLVAVLFLIFEIEALFLFAWAVSLKETARLGFGWASFIEATIFIFVLLAGLVYIMRLGVMNWAPQGRRPNKLNK